MSCLHICYHCHFLVFVHWSYFCQLYSIIALHETRPKVIIRFTLKNTRNNMKESWTQLLEGETLEDLFDSVYETVESNKLEVW